MTNWARDFKSRHRLQIGAEQELVIIRQEKDIC